MIVINNQPTLQDWAWPLFLQPRSTLKFIPGIETTCQESQKDTKSEPNTPDGTVENIPTKCIPTVQASQMDDYILLAIDFPGVKAENINVTVSNYKLRIDAIKMHEGKATAKFHRTFSLDPETIEYGKLEAYLSDGVLMLKIPKKPSPQTISITPTLGDVLEDKEGVSYRRLEVPGVKAADLKISVTGVQLLIEAKREIGNFASVIKNSFKVDGEKLDLPKTEAFLSEGILTLATPLKRPSSPVSYSVEVKHGYPVNQNTPNEQLRGAKHNLSQHRWAFL